MDDEELLELVEMEIWELLILYEFFGNDILIVLGLVLLVLEVLMKLENKNIKRGDDKWVDKIFELMDNVD